MGRARRPSASSTGSTSATRCGPRRCCSREEDGTRRRRRSRSASCACRSAARRSRSGCRCASRPTPRYRAAASSRRSQAANEERAREARRRGCCSSVPNAASAPVLAGPARLDGAAVAARLGARSRLLRRRLRARARRALRARARRPAASGDRVLRDDAWLNWRFADAPRDVRAPRTATATRPSAGAAGSASSPRSRATCSRDAARGGGRRRR